MGPTLSPVFAALGDGMVDDDDFPLGMADDSDYSDDDGGGDWRAVSAPATPPAGGPRGPSRPNAAVRKPADAAKQAREPAKKAHRLVAATAAAKYPARYDLGQTDDKVALASLTAAIRAASRLGGKTSPAKASDFCPAMDSDGVAAA